MLSSILCWPPVSVAAAAISRPTSACTSAGADIGTRVLAGRGLGQPVNAETRACEVKCLSLKRNGIAPRVEERIRVENRSHAVTDYGNG